MPHVILIRILVEHIILALLVDSVVSKVHVAMLQIHSVGARIRHGAESSQTFLMDEDPQRVTGGDEDINAEVELKTIQ